MDWEYKEKTTEKVRATSLSIRSVLGRTWAVAKAAPAVFCALSLMEFVPNVLFVAAMEPSFLTDDSLPQASPETTIAVVLAYLAVAQLSSVFFQGATAMGVSRVAMGERPSVGQCLSGCAPFAGTLLLLFAVLAVGMFLGLCLLVIPGLILWCLWAVTVQVCVLEGKGLKATLKRGAELTKGNRLRIFGLLALVSGVMLLFSMGADVLWGGQSGAPLLTYLIKCLILVLPNTFYFVMLSVLYHELRACEEGRAREGLANVFD